MRISNFIYFFILKRFFIVASLSFRVTTEKSFKESKNLDKKPDWQSGVSAQPSLARTKEVDSYCTALAT